VAAAAYQPALATGFTRALLADAGIALLGLAIAIAATRSAAPTLTSTQRSAPAVPAGSAQPRRPSKDTCDRRDTNDHSQTHHGRRTQSMA
jgi:hypothetical protein